MIGANDFVIKNGVLTKYEGIGGDVVIPEGVTSIGDDAFVSCDAVTSVVIPNGVTSIGNRAFCECENMASITFPDSLTSIGYRAFFHCISLSNITIPCGVAHIGALAFCLCKNLTEVVISDGVTVIDDQAFFGCRSLTDIVIPDSVTDIGDMAFGFCDELKSMTVLGNLTSVGKNVFENSNVKTIAAQNCSFESIKKLKQMVPAVVGFFKNRELFTDKDLIAAYEKYAFAQRKKVLRRIFEEDLVGAVELYAKNGKINVNNFEEEFMQPAQEADALGCVTYLMNWKNDNITYEQEEKRLERELTKDFYNVADMKKLWSYKALGNGTLSITRYKGSDTVVVIPERIGKKTVTSIAEEAFSADKGRFRGTQNEIFKKIERIVVPNSVTNIDFSAFKDCISLTSVELSDSITSIVDQVFFGCESLTSITIPCGVTSIGALTFYDCKLLTEVKLPDSVTVIAGWAFWGCDELMSITVPDSVEFIGDDAFKYCGKLTIRTQAGSYAEKYAKENGIPCIAD